MRRILGQERNLYSMGLLEKLENEIERGKKQAFASVDCHKIRADTHGQNCMTYKEICYQK